MTLQILGMNTDGAGSKMIHLEPSGNHPPHRAHADAQLVGDGGNGEQLHPFPSCCGGAAVSMGIK